MHLQGSDEQQPNVIQPSTAYTSPLDPGAMQQARNSAIHKAGSSPSSSAAVRSLGGSGAATLSTTAALQLLGSGAASPSQPAPVPWKQHQHLLTRFQQLQDSYDALMLANASQDKATIGVAAKRRPEVYPADGDAWAPGCMVLGGPDEDDDGADPSGQLPLNRHALHRTHLYAFMQVSGQNRFSTLWASDHQPIISPDPQLAS